MQEDIEDAVAHAIALKGLDAGKVGIMGASYGGYAALMSAAKRPDLYKAALGICGVYDLPDMLAWEEREDDLAGKPIYEFWTKRIGDRRTEAPAIEAASPRRRVAEITCPVCWSTAGRRCRAGHPVPPHARRPARRRHGRSS
jgi:dipeptidyl aminopeptidase/acylaminoacyl peptidase